MKTGQSQMFNAIWVLMREHSITVDEAKEVCRQKIKDYVVDYLRIVEENQSNMNLSLDLRKFIEAMQYSLSGNAVWSRYSPRYNPEAALDELQH